MSNSNNPNPEHGNDLQIDDTARQEMLEAAETLILLSRQAVVHNQQPSTSVNERATTPDDEFPTTLSNETISEPSSCDTDVVTYRAKPWFRELLEVEPLKSFVRLGLRANKLNDAAISRLEEVLQVMTARNCVQEACWYLERYDWNVDKAITEFQDDEVYRYRIDHGRTYGVANNAAEVVTSANYSPDMLNYSYLQGSVTRYVAFPFAQGFRATEPNHLKALNQWRVDMARLHNMLPATHSTGSWYTDVEKRFIRTRYADRLRFLELGYGPGWADIAEDYNKTFQGRYVPGAVRPCGPRIGNSMAQFIEREFRHEADGTRITDDPHVKMAKKIGRINETEQNSFDALWPPAADAGDDEETNATGSATQAVNTAAGTSDVEMQDGGDATSSGADSGDRMDVDAEAAFHYADEDVDETYSDGSSTDSDEFVP